MAKIKIHVRGTSYEIAQAVEKMVDALQRKHYTDGVEVLLEVAEPRGEHSQPAEHETRSEHGSQWTHYRHKENHLLKAQQCMMDAGIESRAFGDSSEEQYRPDEPFG